jgi:hypothetical protein
MWPSACEHDIVGWEREHDSMIPWTTPQGRIGYSLVGRSMGGVAAMVQSLTSVTTRRSPATSNPRSRTLPWWGCCASLERRKVGNRTWLRLIICGISSSGNTPTRGNTHKAELAFRPQRRSIKDSGTVLPIGGDILGEHPGVGVGVGVEYQLMQ